MTVDFSVSGLDGLLSALNALGNAARRRGGPARNALWAGAKIIRDEARKTAPVDSGALRNHIVATRDQRPEAVGAAERYIVGVKGGARRPNANTARHRRGGRGGQAPSTPGSTYYWRFLEFGTAKQAPKPFLVPAFETQKEAALTAIVETMKKDLDALAATVAAR